MYKFYIVLFVILFPLINFSQCTAAKEPDMQKYLEKTQNQDAQGCSQCGMLALYFCSARYCVKPEDIQKVGQLIKACKQNIINMGQPYCCPEYINKEPEWGKDAGGAAAGISAKSPSTNNSTVNTTPAANSNTQLLNVLGNMNLGTDANKFVENYAKGQQLADVLNGSTTATNSPNKQDGTGQLLNALSNVNLGSSANTYVQNYAQAQQIAEVATGIIDLFTPSPEEKARKEAERLAADKRAEEYRQAQLKAMYENEQNAKKAFSNFLQKYPPTSAENKSKLVVDILDNYISTKFGVNVDSMIPEWTKWIKELIDNNDKFSTVVFAGKALGFNVNKFQYNIGLSKDEAIKLLEKVSDSEPEFKPFVGFSYTIAKKSIAEKTKKKKTVLKEFNTFLVDFVSQGSAAETADIKKDDVIMKINNAYIDDFANAIQKCKIGDKISLTILRTSKEIVKPLIVGSIVKDNYNVDATLILARHYNLRNGGNNPEKALYYFTKAAENGSPNAMFALGEIYQNNVFGDKKTNVKFKFKKNTEFALEWYIKSIINTNYSPSNIYSFYKTGSAFEPQSFDELITMYNKGIGCKKSPEKAEEILALKNDYLKIHPENKK